jgi:hypothetical protein
MANDDNKDTLAESWLRSLKNRPTVAALLLVVIIITGIASFTDSVDKIVKFFVENSNKLGDAKKTDQNVRLEQAIVGTWIPNVKKSDITGDVIKDIRTTFVSDGTYHVVGTYTLSGGDLAIHLPVAISGTWSIRDSELHWKVESSNVPLVVKEGFSSITKIISITNDKWTYVDPADGQTKVDFRIK